MSKKRTAIALLAAAVSASPLSSAYATITFNLIGLSTLTPDAQAGFQAAANRWSSALDVIQNGTAANITLNISVGFTALDSGVIAETNPIANNYWYTNFRSALNATSSSANDATADASLPTGATYGIYINHTSQNSNSATPYVYNASTVNINRATAKALGLIAGNDTGVDAGITFSSAFTYDFDPSNGTDSGAIDFVGVVTHEFGHALGFGSNVDILDSNQGLSQSNFIATPLDMFRYSSASNSQNAIDMTVDTREKYFSLNKGATNIADFSNGESTGDFQASHWKHQTPTLGIMDPAVAYGQTVNISSLDREAFDVIGFAQVNTWKWTDTTSSSTAYWANAARWNADGVPDNTISTVFANGATTPYTVSINTNSTAKDITVANDAVTFSTANSTLTSQTINLGQSSGNTATLNVQRASGGQVNTGNITVGAVANTTGHLNIQNGGIVSSTGALAVAPVATSVGTVTITAGTLSTTGNVSIGGTTSLSGGAGSLTVNSGALLSVGGSFKIWGAGNSTANVAGGTLNVSGASTIATGGILNETAGTYSTNGLTLNGSLMQSGGIASLGAVSGTGSATVSAGTLNANAISIAALMASGTGKLFFNANGSNTGASRLSSISLTGNGTVDLNDNDLILDYTGNSPIGTIRSDLLRGFNSGYWNGAGLTSTAAHNDPDFATALGYSEAGTLGLSTFDGQSVDPTTLLVKYTYYGDTNLDGKVDQTDFQNFLDGLAATGSTWFQGDFTYDGTVDLGNDFSLLLNAYLDQGGTLGSVAGEIQAAPALSSAQRATLLAIVPEPSTLILGMVLGWGFVARRRRAALSA
jgi:hypothetical protein